MPIYWLRIRKLMGMTPAELREVAEEAWTDVSETYPEWNMVPFEQVHIIVDKRKTRGGATNCSKTRPVIYLSVYQRDRFATDNTMRHEIAHIMAGHSADHNATWRQYAVLCGAKPERCSAEMDAEHKYPVECLTDGCDFTGGWHRMGKGVKMLKIAPQNFRCPRCKSKASLKACW